ncbi:MAG: hypothetical protein FD163_732 [Hyphomonadaceae bacterium]|nr:MAG: hypothetical protein FD128_1193 [Hyphomonadaceae bacterium]KAF0186064.1 MAG: hypothetical protein FD163_732 [Hyphomonadaceae bacterium]
MFLDFEIRANLNALNALYLGEHKLDPVKQPLYYSKLAVIELNGWCEEAIDFLIEVWISIICDETEMKRKLIKEYVEPKSSCSFVTLKKMCIGLVGEILFEKIFDEADGSSSCAQRLQTKLNELSKHRNDIAHVHIGPAARPPIDAPSVTLRNLESIRDCLIEFENSGSEILKNFRENILSKS